MAGNAITFQANFSCFIGSHGVVTGEPLTAALTSNGTWALYRQDDEDPIAWLNFDDVNKIAGRQIVSGMAVLA